MQPNQKEHRKFLLAHLAKVDSFKSPPMTTKSKEGGIAQKIVLTRNFIRNCKSFQLLIFHHVILHWPNYSIMTIDNWQFITRVI